MKMKWKKRLLEIERLRTKHGLDRSLVRQFPDLKVEQRTSPTSDRFYPPALLSSHQMETILGTGFVVSHLHKSGYQVLLKDEAPWFGRKT
jgi:hypothetical protein